MTKLERSTPRKEGVDPKAVYDLLKYYDENETGVHSIMILRHDKVIAEAWWYPYRSEFTNMLFSASKSFTSIAVGFAVQEGRLAIEDRLLKFFPDVLPKDAEPCGYMKELTLRDLLRMATGHVTEPSIQEEGKERWISQFLSSYIEKEPGSHYLYNTAATYMLSAVVQKVTGQKVVDYLKPRLFEPLGFGHYHWEESPEGVTAGGYGFNLLTEDLAKFGVFLRNRGSYGGKQLLNPEYVDEATAKQIDFTEHMNIDSRQGYGYQFWRCQPENSYRAAGAFAQFSIVLPDQEMVIAVTSGAQETQPVLTALWEILLPGVDRAPGEGSQNIEEGLMQFASAVTMPVVNGEKTAPGNQYWNREYAVSQNPLGIERISFHDGEEAEVTVTINGKTSTVAAGFDEWKDGTLDCPSLFDPQPFRNPVPTDCDVSCCCGWTADDQFELRICYNKSPFCDFLEFRFDDCGFELHHQRKTGFQLVDAVYFGRPATFEKAVEAKKQKAKPRAEFRF